MSAADGGAAFSRAIATYEMAKDDLEDESVESNEEMDFFCDAQLEAMDALLQTPAPDLAALVRKLEIFEAEDCFGMSPQYRDPLFDAIISDARRLACVP